MKIPSLDELYSRPGFMVRRAQQIATSIFETAVGELNISPTQFAALSILNEYPDIDQITLSGLLGIDRSTATIVLRSLDENGYIVRKQSAVDRRRKLLKFTPKGRSVFLKAVKITEKSKDEILRAFSPGEADTFLHLLKKLVVSLNEDSRTPVSWPSTSSFNPASSNKKGGAVG